MKSVMEKSGGHPTSGLRPRRKSQLKGFVRERSTAASCRGPLQKIEAPAPRLGQSNNNVLRRGRCRSLWVNFVEFMIRRSPYPRNDPLTTAAPILLVIGGDCTQYPPRDDWVRCWPRDRPRTRREIPSIHSQLTCGRLQRFSFVDDRTDDTCSRNRALRKPMNLSGLLQPLLSTAEPIPDRGFVAAVANKDHLNVATAKPNVRLACDSVKVRRQSMMCTGPATPFCSRPTRQ